MSDFRKFLDEQLEGPEFKAEWDALQPERALVQAMIDARKRTGMTQQQLADRVHVSSRTIISLEKELYNPSLLLAYRIAELFGVTVEDLYCLKENRELEDRQYEDLQ